jgi:hypothetical protein
VKQQKSLVVFDLTFGNLLHLSCRGPTPFECRFLKEFEESLVAHAKISFSFLECLLQDSLQPRMVVSPDLPVSMPHVEMLAEFLVLGFPIFSLTSLGTIQGGLACSTVLE